MKRLPVLLASIALVLTACGEGTPTAQPSPEPSPTPAPTAVATTCEKSTGGNRDVRMFLTDVDVEGGQNEDRVVFDFEAAEGTEADVPYYEIEFVEPPLTEDPTGDELEVAGEKHLRIIFWASGVDIGSDEFRETYTGPDEITPDDTSVIAEVEEGGDFENVMTWYIGLTDEEACYSVEPGEDTFSVSFPLDQQEDR